MLAVVAAVAAVVAVDVLVGVGLVVVGYCCCCSWPSETDQGNCFSASCRKLKVQTVATIENGCRCCLAVAVAVVAAIAVFYCCYCG